MEPFTTLTSHVVRIEGRNIDTDQIIPARFLRNPRKDGYAKFLFHDLRFDAHGAPVPDFPLNRAANRGARILAAGENFGCGSSREGAVYALLDHGIRCVVAPSFGDIFRNNCFKNGVLPVVLPEAAIERLLAGAAPGHAAVVTVDLPQQSLSSGEARESFVIEPFWKDCLLTGADDIDITLRHRERIEAFAAVHLARHPWLALPPRGDAA
jgi:3-isopropylmalate/(R)-2-methylmalate dehydratase small subunit